ncbi:MAG: ABC transporter ATP-binding protein, partial [Devosiaceae bacterium]|nr:ABC transporter ATP-binding protein [Devosiaceae bacterium MH13]
MTSETIQHPVDTSGKVVLTLQDISIDFPTSGGLVHAVRSLSLKIYEGRRVGFIGESGSGKTTTALAVMQMLAAPGFVSAGSIKLGDTEILDLGEEEMRKTRLRRVSYIPQGAMNSLNPIMRIEDQIW